MGMGRHRPGYPAGRRFTAANTGPRSRRRRERPRAGAGRTRVLVAGHVGQMPRIEPDGLDSPDRCRRGRGG